MIQIDMEMPKSCAVCPFNSRCDNCECIPNFCMAMLMKDQEGDCHPMIGYFNDGTHEYDPEIGFTPEDHRQDWCPLKEGHKHLYGNFAEWERFEGNNGKPIWRCSECEVPLGDYEGETEPKVMGYNYCPCCGARMDG